MNNYTSQINFPNDPRMGAGGSGSGSPLGNTPTTRPTVGAELDRNAQALAVLHKIISEIEQRLEVICTPRPPTGESVGVGVDGSGSQMITALRSSGYQIDSASGRLQLLMDRLEL